VTLQKESCSEFACKQRHDHPGGGYAKHHKGKGKKAPFFEEYFVGTRRNEKKSRAKTRNYKCTRRSPRKDQRKREEGRVKHRKKLVCNDIYFKGAYQRSQEKKAESMEKGVTEALKHAVDRLKGKIEGKGHLRNS